LEEVVDPIRDQKLGPHRSEGMKKILTHDLTKVFAGWIVLFVFWLVLPADPPYVDQAVHRSPT
jgi:hypothetical protein